MDILDKKSFPSERTGNSLPSGIYEVGDINKTLAYLLPNFVKVSCTTDDAKLRFNLYKNQTLIFAKKSSFYTILRFTKSHWGSLGDIDGYIQLLSGRYKSDKPVNIAGLNKVHLKCECLNGSIVIGVQETLLYSFGLDKPPGHKT